MSLSFETCIPPKKLKSVDNVYFSRPPLIDTSLHRMADCGYSLYVTAKYCPTYGMSKVSMLFQGNDGTSGLNYVMWEHANFMSNEDVLAWLDSQRNDDFLEPQNVRKKDTRYFRLPDPIVQKVEVEKLVHVVSPTIYTNIDGPLDSAYEIEQRYVPGTDGIMVLRSKSDDSKYYLVSTDDQGAINKVFNDERAKNIRVTTTSVTPENLAMHEEAVPDLMSEIEEAFRNDNTIVDLSNVLKFAS